MFACLTLSLVVRLPFLPTLLLVLTLQQCMKHPGIVIRFLQGGYQILNKIIIGWMLRLNTTQPIVKKLQANSAKIYEAKAIPIPC